MEAKRNNYGAIKIVADITGLSKGCISQTLRRPNSKKYGMVTQVLNKVVEEREKAISKAMTKVKSSINSK